MSRDFRRYRSFKEFRREILENGESLFDSLNDFGEPGSLFDDYDDESDSTGRKSKRRK